MLKWPWRTLKSLQRRRALTLLGFTTFLFTRKWGQFGTWVSILICHQSPQNSRAKDDTFNGGFILRQWETPTHDLVIFLTMQTILLQRLLLFSNWPLPDQHRKRNWLWNFTGWIQMKYIVFKRQKNRSIHLLSKLTIFSHTYRQEFPHMFSQL